MPRVETTITRKTGRRMTTAGKAETSIMVDNARATVAERVAAVVVVVEVVVEAAVVAVEADAVVAVEAAVAAVVAEGNDAHAAKKFECTFPATKRETFSTLNNKITIKIEPNLVI